MPLLRRLVPPALRPVLAILLLGGAGLLPGHAAAQQPEVRREDDRIYFDLQNVDIRSALETISEVMGISYVMGGSVQPGQLVTIQTPGGVPIEEVPDVLDGVLRTYNLTLVRTGDVFTVIPAQGAGAIGPGVAGPEEKPPLKLKKRRGETNFRGDKHPRRASRTQKKQRQNTKQKP